LLVLLGDFDRPIFLRRAAPPNRSPLTAVRNLRVVVAVLPMLQSTSAFHVAVRLATEHAASQLLWALNADEIRQPVQKDLAAQRAHRMVCFGAAVVEIECEHGAD
ncbi:hypothetical protein PFISCL1PPCAC_18009, partial [Pristionchus fissidentatus]